MKQDAVLLDLISASPGPGGEAMGELSNVSPELRGSAFLAGFFMPELQPYNKPTLGLEEQMGFPPCWQDDPFWKAYIASDQT